MEATRDEAALEVWEDEGGSCGAPPATDRFPPVSWFARIYGAQHHLGTLGPAREIPATLDPADPDADFHLICRARD